MAEERIAESPMNRSRAVIAVVSATAILFHLLLQYALTHGSSWPSWGAMLPLFIALALGGVPLVIDLLIKAWHRQFGSDLLAGISIVTSVILEEYLAGTIVVLMLSGGEALEAYAVRRASSVLRALARRMPSIAHLRVNLDVRDVELSELKIGDTLVVYPHEICPVDGTVLEGHGTMDESYLTGEPYLHPKLPGASVLSGAINGESMLVIRSDRLPIDSRYAKIMQVMRDSEQRRPKLRRLGDQLGAYYTPLAVGLAILSWAFSGDPRYFLAVLVVATPCPLLIAIPVAIIGAISLAARRGIIVKDPVILERLDACRTAIFDKTGTLTYGHPELMNVLPASGTDGDELLRLTASLERYSKHPLAAAVVRAAERKGLRVVAAEHVSEKPGQGLAGRLEGHDLVVTHRTKFLKLHPEIDAALPPPAPGMECLVLLDSRYAGVMQFRDRPRLEGRRFIDHLGPAHGITRVILVSGDRESEVRYLADLVGITEMYASQSPEQKLEIVRRETAQAPTVFVGDGINDAPALVSATVGIALGQNSDIITESAGAVVLDNSLGKVDELLHIGHRMRSIALQSAVGGMCLSFAGMVIAAFGYLPPVAGAVCQEIIDIVAVLNALRVAWRPALLTDYD